MKATETSTSIPVTTSVGTSANGAPQGLTPLAAQFVLKLDSYASLPFGWNSYQAPAPSAVAIRNAKALVISTIADSVVPERVEPSAMGGVGITFANDHREAVIEFYNDGTAHALLSDDASGEMQTQPVSPTPDGYVRLINSVRKYLHGE
ncbi:MAG TPA: hypothetical protein VE988_24785 [Gemmataceae bacterium]|nr:hypothetical protein [Gemmataceae bacterium]